MHKIWDTLQAVHVQAAHALSFVPLEVVAAGKPEGLFFSQVSRTTFINDQDETISSATVLAGDTGHSLS